MYNNPLVEKLNLGFVLWLKYIILINKQVFLRQFSVPMMSFSSMSFRTGSITKIV